MRLPARLSHSAFAIWESNPEEFYLKYLAEHRPPRVPQERPAAAGSAFDAFVKSSLACKTLRSGATPSTPVRGPLRGPGRAAEPGLGMGEGQIHLRLLRSRQASMTSCLRMLKQSRNRLASSSPSKP